MRIALDGHMLGTRAGGNETYVRGLLEGFLSVARDDQVLLYVGANRADTDPSLTNGILQIPLCSRGPVRRLTREFPRRLVEDRADVAHFQYIGPSRCPCPMLIAVHDPSFWLAPELLGWKLALRLRLTTDFALRKAAAVLVPSEWTARTLVSLRPKVAGKIHVVPLGRTKRFSSQPEPSDAAIRKSLRLPDRYILFVGRRQRRKNVDRLLAAYRLAVKLEPRLPPLVLVGPNSPADDKIRRTLARWALRDRVLIRSSVSDTSLPAVYRGADLFCYPARYEGFGLPVLEAMSCGCPVIAADEGGLPELLGGSGVLLPPAESRPWAETMVDVHRDEERKHDLAQRAGERARGYSWRRTAEATYSRYLAICT